LACALLWAWVNFVPNSFQIAYRIPERRRYAIMAVWSAGVLCDLFRDQDRLPLLPVLIRDDDNRD
jgi:hypothetical protein